MSLTEEAYFERKWGEFPILASIVSQGQLNSKWTGSSSVADNIFDHVHRLIDIQARVKENANEIKARILASDSEIDVEALKIEFHLLQKQPVDISDIFRSFAKDCVLI
jgi:hypothetical protein